MRILTKGAWRAVAMLEALAGLLLLSELALGAERQLGASSIESRRVAVSRTTRRAWRLAVIMLAVATLRPGQSHAANLITLVNFCSLPKCADGAGPQAGLVADSSGNLFGTTNGGGANGIGTVFEVAKSATGYTSTAKTLVSFSGVPDGDFPTASVIIDHSGNLLGTTTGGGIVNAGTVFEVVKTTGGYAHTDKVLVSFNYTDGLDPFAGLLADASGNLLGTTTELFNNVGGANGTVFEVGRTASGYASSPTVLVNFIGKDGSTPAAGLISDSTGNLLGTTVGGGPNGSSGEVFEIARTASGYGTTPKIIVAFHFGIGGGGGAGNLVADASGNLFGTSQGDGENGNFGTVYEVGKTLSGYSRTPKFLVSFGSLPNCPNGETQPSGLIVDARGNLFGTTSGCGSSGSNGTVFEVAKTASGYADIPTVLVAFDISDGVFPLGGLIADARGNLFGTTAGGGTNDGGTIFEVTDCGFVPFAFAGQPGKANCHGKSVSALAQKYGGMKSAATALGFPSVQALQDAIKAFCGG